MPNISDEEYKRLLDKKAFWENSPDLCYEISIDGIILDCNPAVLRALGYTRDELVGKPLIQTIYSPVSQKRAIGLLEKWKKDGRLRNEILELMAKDNSLIEVELNVDAVKDEKGKILHSISIQRPIGVNGEEAKLLKQKITESEKLNKFMIGREIRVIELKQEVNKLLGELNRPVKYKV